MNKTTASKVEPTKDRMLSEHAFTRLLAWLDQGADSEGQSYLAMRRRLVNYFDRKNCSTPDELADETLNRVARRLQEEGITETESPARYCYIVARFVFMEHLRSSAKEQLLLGELAREPREASGGPVEVNERYAQMLSCMGRCIQKLDPAKRDIILRYYVGKERVKIENRRALADTLGITTNALSIRACRIRDELEICVRQCMHGE
jgi:DNA-directed RNA polymerase specialized sigma24 family protein